MSRIKWDNIGEKTYETGVKQCVLYTVTPKTGVYEHGVAWNGISTVDEKPTGGEPTEIWADDQKYLNIPGTEKYEAAIKAYSYPDEWKKCDGSAEIAPGVFIGQQNKRSFGLSYITVKGNDIDYNEYGYVIHIIYGAMASPSQKTHSTINESPDAVEMSWDMKTTPVPVTGYKPTATLEFDSTKVPEAAMRAIEAVLWGTDGIPASEGQGAVEATEARLPLPDELLEIIKKATGTAEETKTEE